MAKAVIIYGPPGSGKGTQAELLARRFNFVHFDTGRYIDSIVHDTRFLKNRVIQRERKIFDSGVLCTPTWVLDIVSRAVKRIAKAGYGIVISGSPRTLFEAFGDKRHRGVVEVLRELYGKENVFVIKLRVRAATSLKRNAARFVCSVCGLPILASRDGKRCTFCFGPLRKRTLDTPKVIKVRLREYRTRTYPIIRGLKKSGYRVKTLNGEPPPYKVFEQVVVTLKLQ